MAAAGPSLLLVLSAAERLYLCTGLQLSEPALNLKLHIRFGLGILVAVIEYSVSAEYTIISVDYHASYYGLDVMVYWMYCTCCCTDNCKHVRLPFTASRF